MMIAATATPAPDARTLLVVDDDSALRARLLKAFAARGFAVRGAATAGDALAAAREESPELALIDLRLGNDSGLEVVRGLRALDITTKLVVLTGYGSIATAVEAVKLGAASYLTKPVDADQILAAFEGGPASVTAPAQTPSLARVEWEHINRVMGDCGGNVSEAARRLGLHRRSLQRKLAKYPGPESA
jgi:two-component system, response regulator RegA